MVENTQEIVPISSLKTLVCDMLRSKYCHSGTSKAQSSDHRV